MKRGDLVTVALAGDFGKPRPALVIQADPFALTATVTLLLISSDFVDAPLIRLTIKPDSTNGLRLASQVMVDKAMTVRRGLIGPVFGRLDPEMMITVNRLLALFLGLG